jgi:hypothetical protein
MNSTLDAGHPEFLIQIGRPYSRKKYREAKAQAQRMDTVLRCHSRFGYRNLKKMLKAARFFPGPGGINWSYRVHK